MQQITSSEELKEAILQLEEKKTIEKDLLKEEFEYAREKLKPANVVKTTVNNVLTGPNLIRTVMIVSLGITAGVVTKKYFQGFTGRLIRRILGRII